MDGSHLEEDQDSYCSDNPECRPEHPMSGDQEHQSQQDEDARDQGCSSQHALARLRSAADAHRVTLPSELTHNSSAPRDYESSMLGCAFG
jgi:hypothetical protein